jgi:hypothetical protein
MIVLSSSASAGIAFIWYVHQQPGIRQQANPTFYSTVSATGFLQTLVRANVPCVASVCPSYVCMWNSGLTRLQRSVRRWPNTLLGLLRLLEHLALLLLVPLECHEGAKTGHDIEPQLFSPKHNFLCERRCLLRPDRSRTVLSSLLRRLRLDCLRKQQIPPTFSSHTICEAMNSITALS